MNHKATEWTFLTIIHPEETNKAKELFPRFMEVLVRTDPSSFMMTNPIIQKVRSIRIKRQLHNTIAKNRMNSKTTRKAKFSMIK